MEIILKKTKITSSILKQSTGSTLQDLRTGEILGWCMYDKLPRIVCYNATSQTISIYVMYRSLETRCTPRDGHEVIVRLPGNYVPYTYRFENEVDQQEAAEVLERAKASAQEKCQFYI